jgi:deoxyribose-phosphate aldolase
VPVSTVIGFPHGAHVTAIKVAEAEQAMRVRSFVSLAYADKALSVFNTGALPAGRRRGAGHGAEHWLFARGRSRLGGSCRSALLQAQFGLHCCRFVMQVQADIAAVCSAAHARGVIVKVILENAYLTDEQKVSPVILFMLSFKYSHYPAQKTACRLASAAGADFVKTSTVRLAPVTVSTIAFYSGVCVQGYASSGSTPADLRLMRSAVPPAVRVKAAGGVRTLDALLEVRPAYTRVYHQHCLAMSGDAGADVWCRARGRHCNGCHPGRLQRAHQGECPRDLPTHTAKCVKLQDTGGVLEWEPKEASSTSAVPATSTPGSQY